MEHLAVLTDAQFRQKFSGSPIKRIGRNRFVRNVLYAMGNSNQPKFGLTINTLLNDSDPGVSDGALWALKKLNELK